MMNANPRYVKRSATLVLLLLALSACTNKQLYKVGQSYQKSECERAALSDVQFKDCKNIEAKRFEEYERERQEALQTDKP
ncbi:hypothetical protein KO519_13225 [Paraglaciecola agarilytica]|jgi:hypothetical protein|uniref:Lipoprotein n=1 Tax=Paraglaciecola chathamensis TaxID=368405 RepID=A0A8H9I8Y7_9ALTE|nr:MULTISPECIES: hypothetical protein [Paraglaciecola]MBU3018646.1 hypothetical protein [Paraglaciecola agarilytica]GGZ46657.1 hypothetical protein GCM10011274_00240 [Paraglaciecola oceanifecundans]|tara:strand:- start:3089 stop:3328 length:240 start_codon:yes stop_codon:yes gene_type:complete